MTEECVHHWIIDESEGPESIGSCKKCGLDKVFRNSDDDNDIRKVHTWVYTNGARRKAEEEAENS